MSIDARRRYASATFVTLLILSITWPSPIVSANRLWLGLDLAIDQHSFLGREAPSWDVVFWCLAGLFALAILHSGDLREWRFAVSGAVAWNPGALAGRRTQWVAGVVVFALTVTLTWFLLDIPAVIVAETLRAEDTRMLIRYTNRLGGGFNPPMMVIFFALAGLAYRAPHWVRYALAMAMAGLGAGAVAHILKFSVGRTRPEVWLGAFHYARGAANSFPSGHTIGAFAIAGVLLFASRSLPLRVVALLLAVAVGAARILAFRHWTSDVVASALLGLAAAWVAVRITEPSAREQGPSSGADR